jgi:hypothetical protein
MIPTLLETVVPAAQITALLGGLDVATIEEAGISCKGVTSEDQDVLRNTGAVLVMGNAAMARAQLDALLVQGFTREEAVPIVAALMKKA